MPENIHPSVKRQEYAELDACNWWWISRVGGDRVNQCFKNKDTHLRMRMTRHFIDIYIIPPTYHLIHGPIGRSSNPPTYRSVTPSVEPLTRRSDHPLSLMLPLLSCGLSGGEGGSGAVRF
jgi:hypothetical protein